MAGCGGDDDDDGGSEAPEAEHRGRGRRPAAASRSTRPSPSRTAARSAPKAGLDPDKTYDVELRTNCGSFTVRLDQKTSPKTAASFVALARDGFFDGTVFHRIVPDFVIQGGDPTGSGTGGPGYSTRDAPPDDATYTRGVVAMAKTEAEPAGTAGSQFYVVTGADAGLPPDYASSARWSRGWT